MSKNFIDQHDPTKPLEDIPLTSQYTKLSKEEKLLIALKLKGFDRTPPSIRQFYEDEYYMGCDQLYMGGQIIFPFWKDFLDKLFPNPLLQRYPLISLSGSVGIGKSLIGKMYMAYTLAKISCCPNPWKTIFMRAYKPLSFVIFHKSEDTAKVEFVKWLKEDVEMNSPFFRNLPHNHKVRYIASGPKGAGGLGSDVLVFLISEVDHWDQSASGSGTENANARVASSLIRLRSRFDYDKVLSYVGGFIMDSSAKGAQGPTDVFIENADPNYLITVKPSHWQVVTKDYEKSKGETFPVYTGDGKYPPQILPADYRLLDDQDPGKVLKVPIQLLYDFKNDLTKSLQDLGGVSLGNVDSFFGGSIEHVVNCSKIKNRIPEVCEVDFYDKTQKLIDVINPMVQLLPYRTPLWIGLDIGVKNDITGLSIVSFDGWDCIRDVRVARVKCWCMVGIGRKEGQQTSLFHIFDLLMTLSKRFEIIVSADQAFSRQLLQDLEREGVKTEYISTDRTTDPAIYLKNLFQNELIEVPEHKRFQRECFDLRYVMRGQHQVIDHPKKATQNPRVFDVNNGVGSKDIWDSLASACYSLKISIDKGEEMGYGQGFSRQMESLKNITQDPREEAQKRFQGMLEDIF